MEKKRTSKPIKVGASNTSQLLFAMLFIAIFLLTYYVYNLTNTRQKTELRFSASSLITSIDGNETPDIIGLKDNWIFVPNLTKNDIVPDMDFRNIIMRRPYATNATISTLGWKNLGQGAVWHNTLDGSYDTEYIYVNGLKMQTGAYIMELELDPTVNTLYLDLGHVTGHAFVYSNGYLVGNIGDSYNFSLIPDFAGGYNTLAIHNTSSSVVITILFYSNAQTNFAGLNATPLLLDEDINSKLAIMPTSVLSVVVIMSLIAIAGGFLLSRTFSDPKTYFFFAIAVIGLNLYTLVNCNFFRLTTPYKMVLEFLFLYITAAFSYAFVAFLFSAYNKEHKKNNSHMDVTLVSCLGAMFVMLGLLDSRLMSTSFHRSFLLIYVLGISIANLCKVIFRYINAKNATIGICASISLMFMFLNMVSPKDILSNTPLYIIYYLISLFALIIYFVYKYIIQFSELVNSSKHLQSMVEEKTAHISMINRDLYNTNKKLIENEEARKNVMSNVSHDLRTPITAIRGYSELLLQNGDTLNEEQKALYLQNIVKRSTQMERIVADIVEISKMESSGFEFEFMDISMNELLDELYMLYSSDMRNGEKKILIDLPDDDLLITKADPKRISRVFENLISNAINYTKEKAEIKIRAWRTDADKPLEEQRIHITISDDGIGIPPNELPRIFDRFYRAKNSGQNIKGTGLGLSIVKMIIDKHDAEISVESVLGEGTTFHVIMKPTY